MVGAMAADLPKIRFDTVLFATRDRVEAWQEAMGQTHEAALPKRASAASFTAVHTRRLQIGFAVLKITSDKSAD